ncbi:colanic acid biosynthesis glycosyltransferase WcaL [Leclercia adecarboxylata]|uniref:Colanic acid biosynthesis glycosyltransferase WcaL n=1 Tax=Leclercia adecarboxylata TaxID=83655 RepID=A0A4U9I1L9_9ENTR|nr:colanic acid biosynthesis glycosyltransferase WcaL [Leclercia adecarboxylata]
MNFGTPAIAINYEHKSAGIMQQLGMPEMAVDIRHLLDGSLGADGGRHPRPVAGHQRTPGGGGQAERENGIRMVKSVLDRGRGGQMKVGFFLLKFPLSSETFVLNQITAFIDMGYDVEIVALQKGDTQNTHAAWTQYDLASKTRWLQDEPQGKLAKLCYRAARPLRGLHRPGTWKALNVSRYGAESRNLILSAICGQTVRPWRADVFIAHFGPAGVTAAKLRELGVIDGKIATVFHGNRHLQPGGVGALYPGVSTPVPARRYDAANKRSLGRTAQKYGLPGREDHRLAHGRGYATLYPTAGEDAGKPAADHLCGAPDREKRASRGD